MVDASANRNRTVLALQKAAQSGDPEAQCELGMMYEHGLGMPKDYQAALFWFRHAADAGSAYAQYKLAMLYENGHGVEQALAQAAAWLRKAAEQGLPEAQYRLGLMLETGRGVTQKYSEAAMWYLQAANQGLSDAQFRLGLLYENALGVTKDMQAAARYYKEAASRGNTNAYYSLGVMYVTGEGVPKDTNEAARLFELAAAAGHKRAKQQLNEAFDQMAKDQEPDDDLVKMRRARQQKLTEKTTPQESTWAGIWPMVRKILLPSSPAAIASFAIRYTPVGKYLAQISASQKPLLFGLGVVFALIALATGASFFKFKQKGLGKLIALSLSAAGLVAVISIYLSPEAAEVTSIDWSAGGKSASSRAGGAVAGSSRSTAPNATETAAAPVKPAGPSRDEIINAKLLKGAEKGDAKSQYQLAVRYEQGQGLEKEPKLAVSWYKEAALKKDKEAQCRLGIMYKNGDGVDVDYKEALKWLLLSAKEKCVAAMYQLGLMYEFGEGVPQSYKTAGNWYTKAVEKGDAHSEYRLGLFYLKGLGVPRDETRAIILLNSAAAKDLQGAGTVLLDLYKNTGKQDPASQAFVAKISQMVARSPKPSDPGSDEWLHETVEGTDFQKRPAAKAGGQKLQTPNVNKQAPRQR